MEKETEIETGKSGAGGIDGESPSDGAAEGVFENPSVLNSKEDLKKLSPELRAVIEKYIPTEEELKEEREKWEREVERQKESEFLDGVPGEFCPETPGPTPQNQVNWENFKKSFKRIFKKFCIWAKFRLKIGVKYKKVITHDEWMAVRAEPGYFIYSYEHGFLKNPKVIIKSPCKETDYIMDPKGTGHILIRRGLPIGIGSHFKVAVEIR